LLARGYGIKNTIRLDVAKAMDSLLRLRVGTSVIIPVFTFIVIAIGCVFIYWFRKTKLGQDMRATGFDIHVSRSAGINVDKVRLQSVIISTVLACYGQIIFLQNIGNINVYNGADQVHLFATAALLVGGAAITKALISNVLVGTVIFHLMFIVMPAAGNAIMGQAILGEHLRMFISYGVVTIALVIHAWKNKSNTSMD
jgi:simple sugar transport system permease protein